MKSTPLSAYFSVHTRAAVEVASAQAAERNRFGSLAVKRISATRAAFPGTELTDPPVEQHRRLVPRRIAYHPSRACRSRCPGIE
jgi:hypothetical protein